MNFDFPDELKQLREQAGRFLTAMDTRALTRRALDGVADDGAL